MKPVTGISCRYSSLRGMVTWMTLRTGWANTAAIVALALVPFVSVALGGLGKDRVRPGHALEKVALAPNLQLGDGVAD
jgi:hypothetical protein